MVKAGCDPPNRKTHQNQHHQCERDTPQAAIPFPSSARPRCPAPHDTSPDKNIMCRGFGKGEGTPCLVHLCIHAAKFKAFGLNEMKAMMEIVAECEFVCTKKTVDFPGDVPDLILPARPNGWHKIHESRDTDLLVMSSLSPDYFFGLAEGRLAEEESRAISASCLCASSISAGCVAKPRYCCMCCDAPE